MNNFIPRSKLFSKFLPSPAKFNNRCTAWRILFRMLATEYFLIQKRDDTNLELLSHCLMWSGVVISVKMLGNCAFLPFKVGKYVCSNILNDFLFCNRFLISFVLECKEYLRRIVQVRHLHFYTLYRHLCCTFLQLLSKRARSYVVKLIKFSKMTAVNRTVLFKSSLGSKIKLKRFLCWVKVAF